MYLDHHASVVWARRVARIVAAQEPADVEVVVLPGFPSLEAVAAAVAGTGIALGAQDVSAHSRGPFTGDVSASSLAQVGCRYVEIGHAERRRLYREDDALVGRKLARALTAGLIPLLCVGEPERMDGQAAARHCAGQVDRAMAAAPAQLASSPLVVAYEPVWAIGAGEPAPAGHIRAVCGALRSHLEDSQGGRPRRVVYGGTAGPGLLARLGQAVDGLFLGRSAHDPLAFGAVLQEAVNHHG
jgi:triosephosphate isomerase